MTEMTKLYWPVWVINIESPTCSAGTGGFTWTVNYVVFPYGRRFTWDDPWKPVDPNANFIPQGGNNAMPGL
jgi:hypothetical protein